MSYTKESKDIIKYQSLISHPLFPKPVFGYDRITR